MADLCAQGVAACIGETAGICAADGSGLTTAGTDCSLSGEVCNESGVCAPLALDTFGATSSSSTSTLSYSNRYLVTEGRTLTQIEQWMTLSAGATLTWVVYESTSQFGTYTQLLSLPVAYPLGATATFVSSGAISVPLVAGRYYMIGAIVTAGSRTMYYQLYSADKFLSFGKGVQGAYFSPSPPGATASPITASRVPYQRLTTVP